MDRVNARVAFISDDMTPNERPTFEALFEEVPVALTVGREKMVWSCLPLASLCLFAFACQILRLLLTPLAMRWMLLLATLFGATADFVGVGLSLKSAKPGVKS